jgi:hypothetical protein
MGKEELSNEDKTINTEFGQKAQVERHELLNKEVEILNRRLQEIAKELNPVPKTLNYLGTMAVHVYQSEKLEQLFFSKQTVLKGMKEMIASKAFEDLRGTVMESYARKRQTRRSGF